MSTSVANGFKTLRDLKQSTQDTTETEKFCQMFDKFFDICNTCSVDEHKIKRKPNLCPFYNEDDERLKVIYFNCGSGWWFAFAVVGRDSVEIFRWLAKMGGKQ